MLLDFYNNFTKAVNPNISKKIEIKSDNINKKVKNILISKNSKNLAKFKKSAKFKILILQMPKPITCLKQVFFQNHDNIYLI